MTDLAGTLGLEVLHVRDVRREHKAWAGFPDLLVVGPGGLLLRELKQAGVDLRGAQKGWRSRLREVRAGRGRVTVG